MKMQEFDLIIQKTDKWALRRYLKTKVKFRARFLIWIELFKRWIMKNMKDITEV